MLCDDRCVLVFAGSGPSRRLLEREASARGIMHRIRFAGALERNAMIELFCASDLFLFSSTTETQGIVLAEALAAGLPIVAVDSPVAREILAATDAVICNNNGAAIADAVIACIGRDTADTAKSIAARRVASQRFDLRSTVSALLASYRRVCASTGATDGA